MSAVRNEWLSPGAIIGSIGLAAAMVATYSSFNGRVSVAEDQSKQLEKRLDRLESKVDVLLGRGGSS